MATLSPWLAAVVQRNRETAKVSQEELADRASVHRTYISLVERAKRNPSVDVLDRIAVGLGTAASALLAEAESGRTRSHGTPPKAAPRRR